MITRYIIEMHDTPLLVAELDDGTHESIRDPSLSAIADKLDKIIANAFVVKNKERQIEADNQKAMQKQEAERTKREAAEREESLRMTAEMEENERLAAVAEGLRRKEIEEVELKEAAERRKAEAEALAAHKKQLDAAKKDIKS